MYCLTNDIAQYHAVLYQFHKQLEGAEVSWVITSSLSFALQGVASPVRDIDVQNQ